MWLDKLQPEVVRILAALTNEVDIQKLAVIADKTSDTGPIRQVSFVSPSDDLTLDTNQQLQFLTSELKKLSLRLDELQNKPKRSRSNSVARHNNRRPRSASRRPRHSQHGNCWYHEVFGSRTKKFQPPCAFQNTFPTGKRPAWQPLETLAARADNKNRLFYICD
ncbi:unnamed protein product [Acanthosepion pharaonis]|uniref:Uncharacterized protein n=1 Tax=Acanthosepion pharaonis TaxID=158019 RepID=A0A812C281_ACAPH|nr:unnamed protein product [Sepia pharaonis]